MSSTVSAKSKLVRQTFIWIIYFTNKKRRKFVTSSWQLLAIALFIRSVQRMREEPTRVRISCVTLSYPDLINLNPSRRWVRTWCIVILPYLCRGGLIRLSLVIPLYKLGLSRRRQQVPISAFCCHFGICRLS